jgi:hypothetical protein
MVELSPMRVSKYRPFRRPVALAAYCTAAILTLTSCSKSSEKAKTYSVADACAFLEGRVPTWDEVPVGGSLTLTDTQSFEEAGEIQFVERFLKRETDSRYVVNGTTYDAEIDTPETKTEVIRFELVATADSISGTSSTDSGTPEKVTFTEAQRPNFEKAMIANFHHALSCTAAAVTESGGEFQLKHKAGNENATVVIAPKPK